MKAFKRFVRNFIRFFQFAGFKYYCPFCNRHARIFTPITYYPGQKTIDKYKIIAMGINPHYRCPRCNSSDKERLVWKYLTTHADILSPDRQLSVLHIAPEKNTQKKLRGRANIKHVAGDMFMGAPKYTTEHYGGAAYLDVTDMFRFGNNTFDLIICNHVLEHVPDDLKGMREIYRVLKKGGFAILQVPVSRIIEDSIEETTTITEEERTEKFGQSDHVRIYAEKDYFSRLASVGFSVEVIPCKSMFFKKEAKLWGVNPRESIYVARKK